MTCFIEFLTVRAWLFTILPRLVWMRLRGERPAACWAFDATRGGQLLAHWSRRLTGVTVAPLRFRLIDVKDEQGLLLRLRIAYQDLAEVQRDMMADPLFQQAVSGEWARDRFPAYVAKAIATPSVTERQTLWRALLTIQVCAWHERQQGRGGRNALFFMERRMLFPVIARYASRHGLIAIPVPRTLEGGAWRRRVLAPELKRVLYRLQALGLLGGRRIPRARWATVGMSRPGPHRPRLGVEYYGALNLDRPERYSNLFFWPVSGIPGRDLLMTFNMEGRPVNARDLAELQRHGIDAVAMRPRVWATPGAEVFLPRLRGRAGLLPRRLRLPGGMEGAWLREQARTYAREARPFWSEFFEAEHVKVYVSWFRYTEAHCALADALKDAGGVSAIYQRAYESFPSAETSVMTDIFFAYSQAMADLEQRSGSQIAYLVTTGYLGDRQFALLRQESQQVRERLQRHGAQRIVAFTDENSREDERWHTGHGVERENYAFLLERVLKEPWFGLVLKPKTPATLRRRLGPVAELLAQAEATGRCFMFEDGVIQGSYPPAAAAMAADLMIHGHLNAGTAGLEAALAGVPTLLLDRFGWSVSPLYRLGVGRVVFTEWDALWKASRAHWRRPGGIPGFGDWSPMLDELDPFRDGRAAERMGTYLRWLLEGFQAGLARDTVMADAASRYAAQWGSDKIAQVNRAGSTKPFLTPLEPVAEATEGVAA